MPVRLRAGGVISVNAAIDEGSGPFAGLFSAYARHVLSKSRHWRRRRRCVWPKIRVAIKYFVILFSNSATDSLTMDA